MIKKIYNNYINWFFYAYKFTADQLGFYRVLFIVSLLLFNGVPQFHERIALFPEGFFNPPPFFSLFFSEILPLHYFQITDILIYVGLFSVLTGFFTKISGIITAFLIVVSSGFLYSSGKIDHGFLIWFGLFLFSFSGWGKSFSVDSILNKNKNKKTHNWTVSLYSMALGFAFFTAGFIKLVSGWLSSSEAMLRGFFLRNYYVQHKQDYLASYFENFDFFLFWEAGDWFTILFEMLFFISIFWVANFRFFTVLAVFFHGAVLLLFNIAFSSYMIIYVLFWIPQIPDSFWKKINILNNRLTLPTKIGLIASVLIIHFTINYFEFNFIIRHAYLFLFFCFSLFILFFKPRWIFKDETIKEDKKAIIRFDGVCNLCNGFVQFVIQRDKKDKFRFKPLQDDIAEVDFEKETNFSTIILEKNQKRFDKSSAFANIVRELKGGWSYLYLTTLIPLPFRNFIYSLVAKNRYKMFGKKDSCMIPTENLKEKFL